MKHFFWVFTLIFLLSACRNTQEAATKIYGAPMPIQVDEAMNQLELGTTLQASLDTLLGEIPIQLYTGPCEVVIQENKIIDKEGFEHIVYNSHNQCTEMQDSLIAGYVYLPVTDQFTKRPIWVPCPALLKQNTELCRNEALNFKICEVYLNAYGYGTTRLLVQI